MTRLGLAVVLAASLLFTGCFEILEEIWVNNDGTGRIKIDIGVSEAMMSMGNGEGDDSTFSSLDADFQKTKEEVEKNPKIKRIDFKQYTDGGMKHFVFDVEVNDLSALNDFQRIVYAGKDSSEEGAEKGMPLENSDLTIEKKDGKIVFVRTIGEKTADQEVGQMAESDTSGQDSSGKAVEEMGNAMAGAMFGNYNYTVRLHADNISTANGKIDDQKKMVEWKIPFGQLVTGKHKELRAEIVTTEGNMVMMIVGAVLVIGVLGGIVAVMRRKKESPTITPQG